MALTGGIYDLGLRSSLLCLLISWDVPKRLTALLKIEVKIIFPLFPVISKTPIITAIKIKKIAATKKKLSLTTSNKIFIV
jgi:hypothetical protein